MPCRRASCFHLPLIVIPQRCSVLHGIGIGEQDGCQARVFCILTRPKSWPKSATFRGCDSRNNLMPGRRASRSHLSLIVMPQRCSVLHGIGMGDQDGCQARVFCIPTRPKSQLKVGNFSREFDSRNNLMPSRRASRSHLSLIVIPQRCSVRPWYWNRRTRMALKPGCFAIRRHQNLNPNLQLSGECDSRNNLMPGRRTSRSHLYLFDMPQRCSVLDGIGIGDQDG